MNLDVRCCYPLRAVWGFDASANFLLHYYNISAAWAVAGEFWIFPAFSGPGPLNLIFRPRDPSQQVGDVSECIWGEFHNEFADEHAVVKLIES